MGSAHMVSFAVEQKLYDPASGKPFNWKRAYSPSNGSAQSSDGRISRMWRFFDLVAPSQKFKVELENMDFPFSVKARQEALAGRRHDPDPGQERGDAV